ncbi:uncharacterized protein LOC134274994 isoform X1 [Saccostrea cucullata]|uniref:uncharacterized protein LOC134274994 isoform X1 n=1 Tax=Saccostrea cuccullata TaxID=36930 RepID=UPI002ED682BB
MALSILYWANYVEGLSKIKRKSEAAVESGRVLKFVLDELRVISANVQASMRDTSYRVQIFLESEDSGLMKSSTCECPMGQYKCHHVAAALLFGYKRASKTDIKCSWLKHPKSAPPKTTKTMEELYPPKQPGYRALKRDVNAEDRLFLFDQLGQLGRFTAMHWILSKEPEVQKFPVSLVQDLLMSEEYLTAECKSAYLRSKLVVSQETVIQTAWLTIGQRENAIWQAVRKMRFTASNFGQIIGAIRRNRLTASLKKKLLSSYNLEKRASIQWGLTHERTAIEEYSKIGEVTVLETGIWLHESGTLGASPDGFIQGESKCKPHLQVKGQVTRTPDIIEVKCPFSAKSMTVSDACANIKDFYLVSDSDGGLHLRTNHDYWNQVQGQLYLTGTQCCDFVVWTPLDLQVVRIMKDPAWEININNMIEFYFDAFLPSL